MSICRSSNISVLLASVLTVVGMNSLPLQKLSAHVTRHAQSQDERDLIRREREQKALLHRAQRLEQLMKDLLVRYERESNKEYVRLIQAGLTHIKDSELLETLAKAATELHLRQKERALANQMKVIKEVERLLAILLDRRSVDDLEREAKEIEALLADLDRLSKKNDALENRVKDIRENARSTEERRIINELRKLATLQRIEAADNISQSEALQDSLEQALDQVRRLQAAAKDLDRKLENETPDDSQRQRNQGEILALLRENAANLDRLAAQDMLQSSAKKLAELSHALEEGELRQEDFIQAKSRLDQALHKLRERLDEQKRRSATAARNPEGSDKARERERAAEIAALERAVPAIEKANADLAKQREQQAAGRNPDAEETRKSAETLTETGKQLQQAAEELARLGELANRALSEASRTVAQRLEKESRQQAAKAEPMAGAADAERAALGEQLLRDSRLDQESAKLLNQASRRMDEAAKALGKGRRSQRAGSLEEGRRKAEARNQEARTRLLAALARQRAKDRSPESLAGEIANRSARLAADLAGSGQGQRGPEQAAKALRQASEAMKSVQDRMHAQGANRQGGNPQQQARASVANDPERRREAAKQTREQRNDAGQYLAKAEQQLAERIQELQQRNRQGNRQAIAKQDEIVKQAEELQAAMAQAAKEGGLQPSQNRAGAQELQKARQSMQRAGANLQRGSPRAAAREQADAANKLEETARRIQEARSLTPAQKRDLAETARKAAELEREILALARRIDRDKNRQAKKRLEEAAEKAALAKRNMDAGDPDASERAQRETGRKIDEAKKELERERDQYLKLRQEELLFKIADEVTQLIDKQNEINRQTLTLVAGRKSESRLPRGIRNQIKQLGRKEGELAKRAAFLAENLKKEQTLIFTYVLDAVARDLDELESNMNTRRPQAGPYVQTIQVEVVQQLKWLLTSLKEEIQRKKQERQEQNGEQQEREQNTNEGDRKRRLVPDVAELKLLKRLEMDIQGRIKDFLSLKRRVGEQFDPTDERRLNRLSLRHAKINDLFVEFVQSRDLGQDPQQDEGTDPQKKKKN